MSSELEPIKKVFPHVRAPVSKRAFEMVQGGQLLPTLAPDGFIEGDLEVTIDFAMLIKAMGRKALLARGGVCRDGPVTVRAVNTKLIPPEQTK